MNAPLSPLDMQLLRANAEAAGQLLKALANPDRLLLLCQLTEGERSVRVVSDGPQLGVVTSSGRRVALSQSTSVR